MAPILTDIFSSEQDEGSSESSGQSSADFLGQNDGSISPGVDLDVGLALESEGYREDDDGSYEASSSRQEIDAGVDTDSLLGFDQATGGSADSASSDSQAQ